VSDLLRWHWHADTVFFLSRSQYGEHDLDSEPKRVPHEECPEDTGIDENVCGRVFHKGNVRVLVLMALHPRIVNLFTVAPVAKTCLPKIVGFLVHPYPRVCDRSTAKGDVYMTDAESLSVRSDQGRLSTCTWCCRAESSGGRHLRMRKSCFLKQDGMI